jgi:hypothetical protein
MREFGSGHGRRFHWHPVLGGGPVLVGRLGKHGGHRHGKGEWARASPQSVRWALRRAASPSTRRSRSDGHEEPARDRPLRWRGLHGMAVPLVGFFHAPEIRCKYCGATFVWQKVEVPRPIPEGARDLGLVDEWVRVVCPGCDASHYLGELLGRSVDLYLCGHCHRPVFPGDSTWTVTESNELLWGLGKSRYHYGCLCPKIYSSGDSGIPGAYNTGDNDGWIKHDPTRREVRVPPWAGCCIGPVGAALLCVLAGLHMLLRQR